MTVRHCMSIAKRKKRRGDAETRRRGEKDSNRFSFFFRRVSSSALLFLPDRYCNLPLKVLKSLVFTGGRPERTKITQRIEQDCSYLNSSIQMLPVVSAYSYAI